MAALPCAGLWLRPLDPPRRFESDSAQRSAVSSAVVSSAVGRASRSVELRGRSSFAVGRASWSVYENKIDLLTGVINALSRVFHRPECGWIDSALSHTFSCPPVLSESALPGTCSLPALSCRASPLSKAPVLARRDLALLQLTGGVGLPATQGGLHRVYFLVFHCKQRGVGTLSLLFSLSHSLDSPSESQGFFEGLLQAGGFGSPATQAQAWQCKYFRISSRRKCFGSPATPAQCIANVGSLPLTWAPFLSTGYDIRTDGTWFPK